MSLKEMPKIKLEEGHYELRSNLHGVEEPKFAWRELTANPSRALKGRKAAFRICLQE